MTLDEITKAASDRLAALDAEAKPHEAALVAINAERDRLRSVIAASKGTIAREPIWVNPCPMPSFHVYPGPTIERWIEPTRPPSWPFGGHVTICGTTTTSSGGFVLS